MEQTIRITLKEGLEKHLMNEVLPKYLENDKGHGPDHIKDVLERSLAIILHNNLQEVIDYNLVYVITYYHDYNHLEDRKRHEILSAQSLLEDLTLKEMFSEEEMEIMKEAVEDHRASCDHEPRNIYGKIISSADRGIPNVRRSITRAYWYRKQHYPNMTKTESISKIQSYIVKKYGEDGYTKVYFLDEEYEKAEKEMKKVTTNEALLEQTIVEIVEQLESEIEKDK